MKKTPYKHQSEAFHSITTSLKLGETPYAKMDTGSGKSLVCAMFGEVAQQHKKRMLVTVPSSELVLQNYEEMMDYEVSDVGICCAKLNKYQTHNGIIIATPTTFKDRRYKAGPFDLMLSDECHLFSSRANSMYQKILRSLLRINPNMKLAGLTATPYREFGPLHEDTLEGPKTFTECCYETDISELIRLGILSEVVTINTSLKIDLEGVASYGRDFNQEEVGKKFHDICDAVVSDMQQKFTEHQISTAIIFCSTVNNAMEIHDKWHDPNEIRIVTGKTSKGERANILRWLKTGSGRRIVVNVGVLTTGFDYKQLDCVVMCRATKSRVLYVQCVGRVLRSHDEKEVGYFLDYGSHVERLGQIDKLTPMRIKKEKGEKPTKACLICGTQNNLSAKSCKECHAVFISEGTDGQYKMMSSAEVLAMREDERKKKAIENSKKEHQIKSVVYDTMKSRNGGIEMIEMKFFDVHGQCAHTHFICLEHDGIAGRIAKSFLKNLFITEEDFYTLTSAGLESKKIAALLTKNPEYFKKIIGLMTIKKPGSRFREIKTLYFDGE